jgi:hypothetical protein
MEEFEEIGNDIDYLEHEAKKSNLRIFGLSETNSESIGSLKSKLSNKCLMLLVLMNHGYLMI